MLQVYNLGMKLSYLEAV